MGLQGYAPHSGFGAKPSLEDGYFRYNYFCSLAVIDVDILIVADCNITRLGHFISAQEGFVGREGTMSTVRAGCFTGWWSFASVDPGVFGPSGTLKTLVDGQPVWMKVSPIMPELEFYAVS